MRIGVPDMVSNSYFPAIAAVDLGAFKAEGLDAEVELIFPVPKTLEALRDGDLDFVAGSAHATLTAFPDWQGGKLAKAFGGCRLTVRFGYPEGADAKALDRLSGDTEP